MDLMDLMILNKCVKSNIWIKGGFWFCKKEKNEKEEREERECGFGHWERRRERKGEPPWFDLGFWRVLVRFDLNRLDGETRGAFLYALGGGLLAIDEVQFWRSSSGDAPWISARS